MKIFILSLFIAFSTGLLANDMANEVFKKGDVLTIKDCDKYGWCQLENGNYIKEFFLKKIEKDKYIVNTKRTYVYKKIKRKISKKHFRKYIATDSKKNYFFGYIRLLDYKYITE
jgi:ABC-type microcin C transport system permease subunit YejE